MCSFLRLHCIFLCPWEIIWTRVTTPLASSASVKGHSRKNNPRWKGYRVSLSCFELCRIQLYTYWHLFLPFSSKFLLSHSYNLEDVNHDSISRNDVWNINRDAPSTSGEISMVREGFEWEKWPIGLCIWIFGFPDMVAVCSIMKLLADITLMNDVRHWARTSWVYIITHFQLVLPTLYMGMEILSLCVCLSNCLPWLCHKLWSLLLEPGAEINSIFCKLLLFIVLITATKSSKYNG